MTGPQRVAPGATAYLSGPNGTWIGSAGIANVKTGEPMRPDARLRIQSHSKTWLLEVALQLAREGRLNLADTVTHWLPGLLPYGNEINLLELLTDTSGLIDDNDVTRSASAGKTMLARVKDPELRARLKAPRAHLQAARPHAHRVRATRTYSRPARQGLSNRRQRQPDGRHRLDLREGRRRCDRHRRER